MSVADPLTDPPRKHARRAHSRRGASGRTDGRRSTSVRVSSHTAAPNGSVYRRRRIAVASVAAAVMGLGVWAISRDRPEPAIATVVVRSDAASATTTPAQSAEADGPKLADIACTITDVELSRGDEGESVQCAQTALVAAGFDSVEINGTFDDATVAALKGFQGEYGLYVDGLLGQRTATELGIWPGDEAFIVRTPVPEPGAKDLWGVELSSVASAGDDAPPLPDDAGQGTGKRVVYDRSSQRVWAIDDSERVVRSYLVSGSRFRNEVPGEHQVYSKTESALGWDLGADLPYMVRYTETERGHIGFHAIPSWRDTGEKLQTEEELGQKLSGGCTRQALLDAQFMWAFADVGTRVLVL